MAETRGPEGIEQAVAFLRAAARWEPQLRQGKTREALEYGMLAKASERLEGVLRAITACVEELLQGSASPGGRARSLGECVALLELWNREAARAARLRFPDAAFGAWLLSPAECRELGEVVRLREDITCGRIEAVGPERPERSLQLLGTGKWLFASGPFALMCQLEGIDPEWASRRLEEAEARPQNAMEHFRESAAAAEWAERVVLLRTLGVSESELLDELRELLGRGA